MDEQELLISVYCQQPEIHMARLYLGGLIYTLGGLSPRYQYIVNSLKYTWLDFIWGANLHFGGLEPKISVYCQQPEIHMARLYLGGLIYTLGGLSPRYQYIVNDSNCRVLLSVCNITCLLYCICLINYNLGGDDTRPWFHCLHDSRLQHLLPSSR